MPLKIGAYIRVSTEEQANVVEGSMDSQKFRIKGYLEIRNSQDTGWGKLIETYVDDGYSAKDTKRPAYQRMMRDLRSGKINLILVTDLSRLSRNIADFCEMLRELEVQKAKFLSIKEQFDSSTAAGEMMLFNMINLAQFERKQTSERVSQNFNTRALKGLRNGSSVLLGFNRDPKNPGKLVIDESEAEWIRHLFRTYLEKGSIRETAAILSGVIPRKRISKGKNSHADDKRWSFTMVRNLLVNRSYVGDKEINVRNRGVDPAELKSWQRYKIVEGALPAIIDRATFDSVQRLLDDAKTLHREKVGNSPNRVFLLSGILRCKECGRALMGQSAHGRTTVHRYYAHKQGVKGKKLDCSVTRINAEAVESTVIQHLSEVVLRAGHLEKLGSLISTETTDGKRGVLNELTRAESELIKLDSEVESVFKFQLQNQLSSQSGRLVAEQLEKLAAQRARLSEHIENLRSDREAANSSVAAIKSLEERLVAFKRGVSRSTPALKKRLLRSIYDVIFLNSNRLEGFYFTGGPNPGATPSSQKKKASGDYPEAFPKNSSIPSNPRHLDNWQLLGLKFAYCANWWT